MAVGKAAESAGRRTRAAARRSSAQESADAAVKIGMRLRHARLTKGLSLRELAKLVRCSESFISKIENDRTRPSLSILHRLVSALEINIAALFVEQGAAADPVIVLSNRTRPVIAVDPLWKGTGLKLERLIPNARGILLQANIHEVAPGGSSDGYIEHEGEELGYVLTGSLELTVDGKVYSLREGDSFFFASHLPHRYRNVGKKRARILWVNTPPSF